MSKTRRWVIAMLLILSGGIAASELASALHAAPIARIERAFHPPSGVRLPSVMAPIATVVAQPVGPPSEAIEAVASKPKARPSLAPPRPRAVERGMTAVEVYPDRTLPPLPPADEEPSDLTFADRRIEAQYAARDYDDALSLALSTCKHGDAFACALAGNMQTRGEGKAKGSPVDARGPDLLVKACKMGDTWGCTRVEALRTQR